MKTKNNYIFVLLLLLIPLIFKNNSYIIYAFSLYFIYSILCIGLNLVIGVTGQFSLGHAAFYGMGAYIAAILATKTNIPFIIELSISAIGASLFAILVAFICIKVSGDYLSVVTLGISEIFRITCMNLVSITGGPMGIPNIPFPKILGFLLNTNIELYYIGLIFFLSTITIINFVFNSKYGRSFRTIKGDETVAASMGIPVFSYKVIAFGIGAFFAGIAGNYMVHLIRFISPENFTTTFSILLVQSIILGGLGSLKGSFIGAGMMIVLTEILRIYPAAWRTLVLSVIIIIMMIKMPNGLIDLLEKDTIVKKIFRNKKIGGIY